MADMKLLEDNLQCSGLCSAPKFWVTRDVTTGPPPGPCLTELKDHFDVYAKQLAYCVLATGGAIFGTFFFHYGLYLKDQS